MEGVPDCEELVGVAHRGWWGGYFDLNIYDLTHLLSGKPEKILFLIFVYNLIKKRNDVCFELIFVIQDIQIIKKLFDISNWESIDTFDLLNGLSGVSLKL